jgi:UPF0271 protein
MSIKQKKLIYILDTSAILSGKFLNFDKNKLYTTPGVSNELKPGGRDYQLFQFLIEKGLEIIPPSKNSIDKIEKEAEKTGDANRLSQTDIEILALALDINEDENQEAVILTDDYSIQNTATEINLKYENINQSVITKKFKWTYRCRGCGRKFKDKVKICPVCGASTKNIISKEEDINR